MNVMRFVAPIGSVVLLTLIAALPLGVPAGDRFFLPLLPVVAVHYWTLRHDAWLPEWVVFLAGLMLDILTHGPLGYWAFIYLLAHLTATLSTRVHVESTLGRLVLKVVTTALKVVLGVLLLPLRILGIGRKKERVEYVEVRDASEAKHLPDAA